MFFLLIPGSLLGLSLLLAYTGMSFPVAAMPAYVHGMFQLNGFFMVLIWGFLAHGFPGMLGGSHSHTRHIHRPLLAMAILLGLVWLHGWLSAPVGILWLLLAAGFCCSLWVTWLLAKVVPGANRRWTQHPLPFLVVPLLLSPVYWLLLGAAASGVIRPVVASDFMLFGIVLPIILTMAYRMLSPMAGTVFPDTRYFVVAAFLWTIGVGLWLSSLVWGTQAIVSSVFLLAGAVGFTISLGIFAPRRQEGRKAQPQQIDQALLLYIRVAFGFLVLGQGLHLLTSLGILPGIQHYWLDVTRHFIVVGFGFVVVAGITQRVFPTFLRGRRSSPLWMLVNLVLVVVGLLLRLGEPFLPAAPALVRVSAAMLYAGIFGYAVHLLRGALLPSVTALHPIERIRKATPPPESTP